VRRYAKTFASGCARTRQSEIFLVHGEYDVQLQFKKISIRFLDVEVPGGIMRRP
jgi:hypothetical protein